MPSGVAKSPDHLRKRQLINWRAIHTWPPAPPAAAPPLFTRFDVPKHPNTVFIRSAGACSCHPGNPPKTSKVCVYLVVLYCMSSERKHGSRSRSGTSRIIFLATFGNINYCRAGSPPIGVHSETRKNGKTERWRSIVSRTGFVKTRLIRPGDIRYKDERN